MTDKFILHWPLDQHYYYYTTNNIIIIIIIIIIIFVALVAPDGITHNQIDHVLVDKRRQSSIIDVRSLRGADCYTDHYIVVATIRERLSLK